MKQFLKCEPHHNRLPKLLSHLFVMRTLSNQNQNSCPNTFTKITLQSWAFMPGFRSYWSDIVTCLFCCLFLVQDISFSKKLSSKLRILFWSLSVQLRIRRMVSYKWIRQTEYAFQGRISLSHALKSTTIKISQMI